MKLQLTTKRAKLQAIIEIEIVLYVLFIMTKVGFVSYTFEVGKEFIELYRFVEEQGGYDVLRIKPKVYIRFVLKNA